MKITIVSNYETLHTRPLSRALYQLLGEDFAFVETVDRCDDPQAARMGYAYQHTTTERSTWVISAWRSDAEASGAKRLLLESDAVIIANAADEWVLPRLRGKKLTFRAHERWYREKRPWYYRPRAMAGGWLHHGRFSSLHLLAASAFTPADAAFAGCFRGKAYRWGYFPEFRRYEADKLRALKTDTTPTILWAGRMIDCKRPGDAIEACRALAADGYRFRLRMAGSGPLDRELRINSPEWVEFLGELPPERLREEMERAHIFLFTSDRREGWGAVLNEAMNSGCAVVASHAAGATPYLVRHGINGLIYPSGDVDALTACVRTLLDAPGFRAELGLGAYETIRDEWNPVEAAGRLVALCDDLLAQRPPRSSCGPCSPAQVIRDGWFSGQ